MLSSVSSTDYPTVPTGKRPYILSDVFKEPYLHKAKNDMVALITEIANEMSLDVSEFCSIISGSGRSFPDNHYIASCDELEQLRYSDILKTKVSTKELG